MLSATMSQVMTSQKMRARNLTAIGGDCERGFREKDGTKRIYGHGGGRGIIHDHGTATGARDGGQFGVACWTARLRRARRSGRNLYDRDGQSASGGPGGPFPGQARCGEGAF